ELFAGGKHWRHEFLQSSAPVLGGGDRGGKHHVVACSKGSNGIVKPGPQRECWSPLDKRCGSGSQHWQLSFSWTWWRRMRPTAVRLSCRRTLGTSLCLSHVPQVSERRRTSCCRRYTDTRSEA